MGGDHVIEMGSEFSYIGNTITGEGIQLPIDVVDYIFTFSGRTSISLVLEKELNISKVLLPVYCCDSMIEPFRKRNIEIDYYDGLLSAFEGKIENLMGVDAILWCNYFGYSIKMPDLTEFKNRGGIIIEDITHSFFSKKQYNKQSDYLVASLRKWGPVLCGGYFASRKGRLDVHDLKGVDQDFLLKKKNAMISKAKYLQDTSCNNKSQYLSEFSWCNDWLAINYEKLQIDFESREYFRKLDQKSIVDKRRFNAHIIYDNLKDISGIKFLFPEEVLECPLFVPICVCKEYRDELRKTLIKNGIYCPVHWPRPNEKCRSDLYATELSLICDQRYGRDDMIRMTNVIRDFLENE